VIGVIGSVVCVCLIGGSHPQPRQPPMIYFSIIKSEERPGEGGRGKKAYA
jgi:hypothetical protein